jgi:TP901 family phage tail tape measure protein
MAGNVKETLTIEAVVRDQVTTEMRRMGRSVDEFGTGAEQNFSKGSAASAGFSDSLGGIVKKAGLAAAALGAVYKAVSFAQQGVSEAVEFGAAMAEVSTLVDISADAVDRLSDKVLDLAQSQLANQDVVAKGLYQAISSGISDVGEALKFVEAGGRLAVAGVADTAQAVDVLSTAVNAYGGTASDAGQLSDVLFRTVKRGKTTIGELAGSLGQVLPIAASLGVSFEEVNAAVAALTLNGVSTSEAVTQVRAALVALLKNSESITEAFAEAGQQFDVADLSTRGLVSVLNDLQEVTGGNEVELTNLLGRVEAVNATLGLTGTTAARTADILQDLRAASGDTGEAFDKQMAAPANQLRALLKAVEVAAVRFGKRVLESFQRVFAVFKDAEGLQILLKRIGFEIGALGEGAFQVVEGALMALIQALDVIASAAVAVQNAFGGLFASLAQFAGIDLSGVAGQVRELGLELDGVNTTLGEIMGGQLGLPGAEEAKQFKDSVLGLQADVRRELAARNIEGALDFARQLDDVLERPGPGVSAGVEAGAVQNVNELLQLQRGVVMLLSEITDDYGELGDRAVVVTEVADDWVQALKEQKTGIEEQKVSIGDFVLLYKELEDSALSVAQQEERVGRILKEQSERAAEARRKEREARGEDLALKEAQARNQLLKGLQRESLTGINAEKAALEQKLYTTTLTAQKLKELGVIGQSTYKQITAAINKAREENSAYIDELESQGLDALLAQTQQLQDESLGGLQAQLAAVDRLIDKRREEATAAAEGNAKIAENLDMILLGLEAERGVRKENLELANQEALAQQAISDANTTQVATASQEALNSAYASTVGVLGEASIGTQEFTEELRAQTDAALGTAEAFGEGFAGALEDFMRVANNDLANGAELASTLASSLSNELAQGFQDILTGASSGQQALEGLARGFAQTMLQVTTQALAMKAVSGLLSALGAGGGGGGAMSADAGVAALELTEPPLASR